MWIWRNPRYITQYYSNIIAMSLSTIRGANSFFTDIQGPQRVFKSVEEGEGAKVFCYCQLKTPPQWVQMQEFCNLTFLNGPESTCQKEHFQGTSGESKIKTTLFSRTYKMNLKKYILLNKILDQHFVSISQRLSFSTRFL